MRRRWGYTIDLGRRNVPDEAKHNEMLKVSGDITFVMRMWPFHPPVKDSRFENAFREMALFSHFERA